MKNSLCFVQSFSNTDNRIGYGKLTSVRGRKCLISVHSMSLEVERIQVLDRILNQPRTVGNEEANQFYAHYCILKNILLSSIIQVR